jgi:hypothetical protein
MKLFLPAVACLVTLPLVAEDLSPKTGVRSWGVGVSDQTGRTCASKPESSGLNALVLAQVRSMPLGGGYAATREANTALAAAVRLESDGVVIDAGKAKPSYCSGATYLVFLKTLAAAQKAGFWRAPAGDLWKRLVPKSTPDGTGIWGRWNANGPGTARLFHELRLGKNFTTWDEARPGDFLKIFWTNAVGKKERGHLVVFLGRESVEGVECVRFWSSNIPGGYGEKSVPKSRIAHALFSRLEIPGNIINANTMPKTDAYLASLLTKESSFAEALEKSGVNALEVQRK